jgi:cytochrome P450
LNAVPGPAVAKWVNWGLKLQVISGRRMYYVHQLHQKYGPFVRIAPDEVSVADPATFARIHKIGSGYEKSAWYGEFTSFPRPTLFVMRDPKVHGARRRLLARGFSKTYLRQNWEEVVREKIRLVVSKLKEESVENGSANILKWWTLMATDVAVHLMFGESFRMIEQGKVRRKNMKTLKLALLTPIRKQNISRFSKRR